MPKIGDTINLEVTVVGVSESHTDVRLGPDDGEPGELGTNFVSIPTKSIAATAGKKAVTIPSTLGAEEITPEELIHRGETLIVKWDRSMALARDALFVLGGTRTVRHYCLQGDQLHIALEDERPANVNLCRGFMWGARTSYGWGLMAGKG